MAKAKILIVDDEGIVAEDIKDILKGSGYTIVIASSGEQAIKEISETHPDLVLMDIVLKGEMDGIEAAEQIRARFNIPVVYLTAYADEKLLQRAKITEPHGYVLKPFGERELLTAIEIALYKYRVERKLKESEQWLSTTLKSIGDAVIATDTKGCIKFMNPVAEALTKWKQEDALDKDLKEVFNIINEETRVLTDSPVTKVLHDGVIVGLENHTLIARDRTEIPIGDSAAPIKDDKGSIIGAVFVFKDVTERKRVEEERKRLLDQVRDSREQLQSLSRRLLEVQEADRRDLASELHDQVGQNLTALSITLKIIHSQFSESEKDDKNKKITGRLKDSLKLVEETIERTRNVMAGLRPPELDDYGLGIALRWYSDRFSERTGVTTNLQGEELLLRLPTVVETALFRIVQEVLTNVVKHAHARQVDIILERVDGMVQLAISDDGVGFDPADLRRQLKEKQGWGLLTIEERAKALGGNVYVKSVPGEGTQVVVQLPC